MAGAPVLTNPRRRQLLALALLDRSPDPHDGPSRADNRADCDRAVLRDAYGRYKVHCSAPPFWGVASEVSGGFEFADEGPPPASITLSPRLRGIWTRVRPKEAVIYTTSTNS